MHLSEEEMYAALVCNDVAYDGVFFYAVRTTGVVCRPSCKSKQPSRENVCFFNTLEEALRLGYRPCKRCRPDLGVNYFPDVETVMAAREIVDREYSNPDVLQQLPGSIGISVSQLRRLFKTVTGETPRSYLQRVRVARAIELLAEHSLSAIDISLSVGFTCLSSYYAAFRNVTGRTMKEYRQADEMGNGEASSVDFESARWKDSCRQKGDDPRA